MPKSKNRHLSYIMLSVTLVLKNWRGISMYVIDLPNLQILSAYILASHLCTLLNLFHLSYRSCCCCQFSSTFWIFLPWQKYAHLNDTPQLIFFLVSSTFKIVCSEISKSPFIGNYGPWYLNNSNACFLWDFCFHSQVILSSLYRVNCA